jgi:hypothetical protein
LVTGKTRGASGQVLVSAEKSTSTGVGVRFSYAEAMTDPAFYIPLAKAAEAAGYAGMTIPDSIAYPFESDSRYPYTPDGNREFLDGKPFI